MTQFISAYEIDFDKKIQDLIAKDRNQDTNIASTVSDIIHDVKTHKDQAILKYSAKLDNHHVASVADLRLNKEKLTELASKLPQKELSALKLAYERIYDFHKRQLPNNLKYTDNNGVTLGFRWLAVQSACLYVPGGLAAYPSSVLMNAVAAKVAGVKRLIVTTPPGKMIPAVAAALLLCEIDEVWLIGGAHAIAAAAYGTETIDYVNVITGPGNAYVAEAKKQVFGKVGIDMIAGPSEILIIADGSTPPQWIAADLLSQAEHDTMASSILISDNKDYLNEVSSFVDTLLKTLPTREVAEKSWQNNGVLCLVKDMQQTVDISNELAPEHLEICTKNPYELMEKCINAGSIFLGRYSPESFGDYLAGPNHVLPTDKSAKFSSGLNVLHFMKRNTFIEGHQGMQDLLENTVLLAEAEGLPAHALAAKMRLNDKE